MSGIIVNNVARASGTIAATPGGLDWSTAVVTGSTVTVEAGKGYFINTTSNACTVTLPASANSGDQIVLADYARTWATNAVTLDSNGNNFQGNDDTYTVDYSTVGQSLNIVYADSTKGWLPVSDDAVTDVPVAPRTQRAIFGFGNINTSRVGVSNLFTSGGNMGSDVTAVGTARAQICGATYGGDKVFFTYGRLHNEVVQSITNLVNNSGVVASDSSAAGTKRYGAMAAAFGSSGQAIIGFGDTEANDYTNLSNIVSNSGVIASDTTGVGDERRDGVGVGYGVGLALFAFGYSGGYLNVKNLVNSSGVVSADVSGVGTAAAGLAACTYGSSGQAVIAFGYRGGNTNTRNLVNSSGVIAGDSSGAGTARQEMSAASYGGDKGIFAFGNLTNHTNRVSNTGTIATDGQAAGTGRRQLAAGGYSYSA
jgi:hypothetical protein